MKALVASEVLTAIRDGNIGFIPRYVDLDFLDINNVTARMKSKETKVYNSVIQLHRTESILPVLEDVTNSAEISEATTKEHCDKLIQRGVLCSLTIPDIFKVFGQIKEGKPSLPDSLDEATNYKINDFDERIAEACTYRNLEEYYLALVKTGEGPVFEKLFPSPIKQALKLFETKHECI
jgi:hypothetical protein